MSSMREKMIGIYHPLMPDFFDQPAVEEARATCQDCVMCDKKDTPRGVQTDHFDPDTKCCTYHPTLPNFLAGAILSDPRPELAEGAERLRAKIEKGIGITPQWLSAPRKTMVLMEASRSYAFGRSKTLLCPYFDEGKCTIWHHRESVCSTFYCKYSGGVAGYNFWDAYKKYMFRVEIALSEQAVKEIDPTLKEPKVPRLKMTLEDLEDRAPDEYAGYWGKWIGREEQFYIACYDWLKAMTPERFAELVTDTQRGTELIGTVKTRYEELARPKLLPMLVKNKRIQEAETDGGVVVSTYSRYDPFFMSTTLKNVVNEFREGETVTETLARLKSEKDLEVPEDMVLRLQLLEVLVSPEFTKGALEPKDDQGGEKAASPTSS